MDISSDLTIVLVCLAVAAAAILLLAAGRGRSLRWRDDQRLFTWEQKKVLLDRAGHRCEHKRPLWIRCRATADLQADHIRPWSRGGSTQLWNGQILCRRHNARKSSRPPGPLYQWRLERRRTRQPGVARPAATFRGRSAH